LLDGEFLMDQSTANQMAGMGFGFIAIIMLFSLAALAFSIWMWWRILEKAGYNGALSLLVLTGIGGLIIQIVLAFGRWPIEDTMAALRGARPVPPMGAPMGGPPMGGPPMTIT
jgi:hypothetical protein